MNWKIRRGEYNNNNKKKTSTVTQRRFMEVYKEQCDLELNYWSIRLLCQKTTYKRHPRENFYHLLFKTLWKMELNAITNIKKKGLFFCMQGRRQPTQFFFFFPLTFAFIIFFSSCYLFNIIFFPILSYLLIHAFLKSLFLFTAISCRLASFTILVRRFLYQKEEGHFSSQ